jgi:hypothetical protein
VSGVDVVLRALHDGEVHLADELTAAAERHRTEHEVHHVALDLALWSREHGRRLSALGHERGLRLGDLPSASAARLLSAFGRKAAEALGHRPEPALLLLRDLRDLHLGAARNSLHWEMLAQAAQAGRDDVLLELASDCHPRTLRQMRWSNTMIKNLAPQALTSL